MLLLTLAKMLQYYGYILENYLPGRDEIEWDLSAGTWDVGSDWKFSSGCRDLSFFGNSTDIISFLPTKVDWFNKFMIRCHSEHMVNFFLCKTVVLCSSNN